MTFLHIFQNFNQVLSSRIKTKQKTIFYIAKPTFLIIIFSILLMQVLDKDTEKATSRTQSSASAPQWKGSAQPSSSNKRILSCQASEEIQESGFRESQESAKRKVYNSCAWWLVQYRTGKRPGTITNPECTLDAIFTLLTPGLHWVCKLMSYLVLHLCNSLMDWKPSYK